MFDETSRIKYYLMLYLTRMRAAIASYIRSGHAGSGKSVLLQRIAWEAALTFQKLCLYLRPDRQLSFDAIRELAKVIDERIYLYIDDLDEL